MLNLEFRIYDNHSEKMLYSRDNPELGFGYWSQDGFSEKLLRIGQDKNGNVVFEGDIIKDSSGEKWVVFWKPDLLGFFKRPLKHPSDTKSFAGLQGLNRWQLIGNIYEVDDEQ